MSIMVANNGMPSVVEEDKLKKNKKAVSNDVLKNKKTEKQD